MSEKTILDEIAEWWHNFWYGQPEQTQHEGTSSADEAGATTEVAAGGGIDEKTVDVEEKPQEPPPPDSYFESRLPRTRGTIEAD